MILYCTTGEEILIDDEDYDLFAGYNWAALRKKHTCYAICTKKYVHGSKLMHRWLFPNDVRSVDHINGNGLDNRKKNLRLATPGQQAANKRSFCGKSKYKGVYYRKRSGKWMAQIMYRYKCIYIGLFVEEEEAARAYNVMARELFGEFALLNQVYELPEEKINDS